MTGVMRKLTHLRYFPARSGFKLPQPSGLRRRYTECHAGGFFGPLSGLPREYNGPVMEAADLSSQRPLGASGAPGPFPEPDRGVPGSTNTAAPDGGDLERCSKTVLARVCKARTYPPGCCDPAARPSARGSANPVSPLR